LSDKKTERLVTSLLWLSFNVHGNEFAGTESAMTVAYELVNAANSVSRKELESTIVILDPH
jgi:hypothetical protein